MRPARAERSYQRRSPAWLRTRDQRSPSSCEAAVVNSEPGQGNGKEISVQNLATYNTQVTRWPIQLKLSLLGKLKHWFASVKCRRYTTLSIPFGYCLLLAMMS